MRGTELQGKGIRRLINHQQGSKINYGADQCVETVRSKQAAQGYPFQKRRKVNGQKDADCIDQNSYYVGKTKTGRDPAKPPE